MPKQNYSKINSYKPVSTTGMKKLDWFFAFLGMIHVSMEEAANILNYRRNTIQYWKQTDDVNLSLIMKIVNALGFYLDIKIWKGDSWEEVSTITKREMSRLVPGKREPHCLAPLVAAMCLYDFTAFRLAKMMNLWVTTVRYWLDCDGCSFELVGRLSRRAFDVEGIKIADRLIPEKHSLKVFESFGDAYAYQALGEKGVNKIIFQSAKDMKTHIRAKSAEMVDDFHRQNQKCASRIRAEMRQNSYEKTSWKLWPEEKMKTYIMSSVYGNYKIGKSKNVRMRERDLQCGDPSVRLMAVCPNDIEYELHQKYAANRVSKEWFRFSKAELDDLIERHGFVRVE